MEENHIKVIKAEEPSTTTLLLLQEESSRLLWSDSQRAISAAKQPNQLHSYTQTRLMVPFDWLKFNLQMKLQQRLDFL